MKTINGVEVLDTLDEILRPAHTALLVVDVQNDFCHPDGHFAKYGKVLGSIQMMLPALMNFVGEAQRLGIFTIFICQQTLPHGRSDSPA
ncbi:MAG: isochorismatase family protein, partial [Lautropia sp.]|nr:isochorismatase family protein [Lautropia sp.]